MAEIVDRSQLAVSKYPWHIWLDGNTWALHHEVDFHVDPVSMRTMVYHKARRSGLRVQTRLRADSLIIRAYPCD